MWRRHRATLLGAGLLAVLMAAGARRAMLGWGAREAEAVAPLPGDEVVPDPQYLATNAVTIAAPSQAVWPWLVQMGAYTRAGWYSFDRLDNGGVPSARRIVPELQSLRVGDVMPTDRVGNGFVVESIEPDRSLVLVIREPDGVTSSAFVLEPEGPGRSRLLVRVRLRTRPTIRGLGYRAVMELGHVPMTLKLLHGVRERAQSFR